MLRLVRAIAATTALIVGIACLQPSAAFAQRAEPASIRIHDVVISPAAPRPGQTATVAAMIERRDSGARPFAIVVRFQPEGGRPFAERRVLLAAGRPQRVSAPWRPTEGRVTIEVTAALATSPATVVARAEGSVAVAAAPARVAPQRPPAAPDRTAPPARVAAPTEPAAQADAPQRERRPTLRVATTGPLVIAGSNPRVATTGTLRVHADPPRIATTEPLRITSTISRTATTDALVVRATP